MKYYVMAEKAEADGTIIYKNSHSMTALKTGSFLVDYENDDEKGEPFVGPLICKIDDEHVDGKMSTFFMSPAIIGTKQFYNDLLEIGIENIEVHPVIIRDEVNSRIFDDYLLLNIIGRVSCANMSSSEYETLGDDMNIIDQLVLDSSKVHNLDLFLVHEDTDCIVISEKVYSHLVGKGYTDIYFEALKLV
ncbi:MAG: hypothetical protein L3J89_08110 [Gammaproteobacteria bacterium]|nr:hypothetical protein [Gammaproteobacteria bacterium]